MVIVDDTLGWEEQYESIKKKVAGDLAVMKKLKGILPQSMLFQVYKALVESHLRYAEVSGGGGAYRTPKYQPFKYCKIVHLTSLKHQK